MSISNTRALILDAARELFVAEGHEAVSMRKVAEKVDHSATAIYHHFRDKQALIEELCHHDFAAVASAFQSIGSVQDPLERIARIGAAYVEFALTYPGQYRFLFMTPGIRKSGASDEGKGDARLDGYAVLRHAVVEAIETGRLAPAYHDPDMTSQLLWGAMHGIASLHILHARDGQWVAWRDARTTAARLSQAILAGMSA